MKVYTPQPPAPEKVAIIIEMLQAGKDRNDVVATMRSLGLNKIACIKLLREYGDLSMHDAKAIVHLSSAWEDRYASDEAFHDVAEQAAEVVFNEESTAAHSTR